MLLYTQSLGIDNAAPTSPCCNAIFCTFSHERKSLKKYQPVLPGYKKRTYEKSVIRKSLVIT